MGFLKLKLWIYTGAMFYLSVTYSNEITVNTPSGSILGTTVTIGNETVYQYRKIPFAKPPIGNLRFRKPVPYGKWPNTLNATVYGPSCMQIISSNTTKKFLPNLDVSEDCLHLNVYAPENTSKNNKKSVMIWIHGGAYLFGQATSYDASYLTKNGDVIVVTINYRLGTFGFLATLDSASKGNYGLWDQKLAIQWVHDNIESFGGDKNYVTIFGESAGSFSVGLQAINPSNRGLFQRAIEESGTALSFLSYTIDAGVFTKLFFNNSNCSGEEASSNSKVIDCLRKKTADEILQADLKARVQMPIRLGLGLGPVIDGEFILDDPLRLLANKTSLSFFKSLDYMGGVMSSEGSLVLSFTGPQLQKTFKFNIMAGIPTRALCNDNGLAYLYSAENYNSNNNIQGAICNKYKTAISLDEQSRQIVRFYGDSFFVAPAAQSLNIHALDNTKSSSYQFLFSWVSPIIGRIKQVWFSGARHASELAFLFGLQRFQTAFPNIKFTDEEFILSKWMQLYWSNFAKTGNPNSNETAFLPHWPSYNEFKDKQSYLHLDLNVTEGYDLYADSVKFWLETIPTIAKETSGGINISTTSVMTILACVCVNIILFRA